MPTKNDSTPYEVLNTSDGYHVVRECSGKGDLSTYRSGAATAQSWILIAGPFATREDAEREADRRAAAKSARVYA